MRSLLCLICVAASCASKPEAPPVAPPPPAAEDTPLPEVRTDADGRRTVRTADGTTVTTGSGCDLEIVDEDGDEIVVSSDGSVRSAERDVVVVRVDGTREVWDHTSRTLVTEEEWSVKRTSTTVSTTSARPVAASVSPASAPEAAKAVICHVPPGNPANQHTLTVGASAVSAHLHHGDYEGECDPARAGVKEHGKGNGRGKKK